MFAINLNSVLQIRVALWRDSIRHWTSDLLGSITHTYLHVFAKHCKLVPIKGDDVLKPGKVTAVLTESNRWVYNW